MNLKGKIYDVLKSLISTMINSSPVEMYKKKKLEENWSSEFVLNEKVLVAF